MNTFQSANVFDEVEILEKRRDEILDDFNPYNPELVLELADIETALQKDYAFMQDTSDGILCSRFGCAL